MNTIEGNKLIAEFMGGVPYGNSGSVGIVYRFDDMDVDDDGLQYNSSWDWLMPVAQKIFELGYTVQWTISDNSTCRIWPYLKSVPSCSIVDDRPWKAIVSFIKWYNNQTPTNKQTN